MYLRDVRLVGPRGRRAPVLAPPGPNSGGVHRWISRGINLQHSSLSSWSRFTALSCHIYAFRSPQPQDRWRPVTLRVSPDPDGVRDYGENGPGNVRSRRRPVARLIDIFLGAFTYTTSSTRDMFKQKCFGTKDDSQKCTIVPNVTRCNEQLTPCRFFQIIIKWYRYSNNFNYGSEGSN